MGMFESFNFFGFFGVSRRERFSCFCFTDLQVTLVVVAAAFTRFAPGGVLPRWQIFAAFSAMDHASFAPCDDSAFIAYTFPVVMP